MNRIACVALLFVACSPIDDNDNTPPDAAPDNEAPRIVMSIPGDKTKGVSVLSKVTMFFDGPLDATTVTNTTVRVRSRLVSFGLGWSYLAGTVAYDEVGYKVTFTPYRPLPYEGELAVIVDGVKDTSGNALTGTMPVLGFRTVINKATRTVYRDTTTRVVAYWYGYDLDTEGRNIRQSYYTAPGMDGTWVTSDDVVNGSPITTSYTPEGRIDEVRSTTGVTKATYDAMGMRTETTGYDAAMVIVQWQKTTYTPEGQILSSFFFDDDGGDNMWKTPDDRMIAFPNFPYTEQMYDAQGRVVRANAKDYGPDAIPKTADDVNRGWIEYRYDSTGFRTHVISHNAADAITNWTAYKPEAMGDAQYSYNAVGTDGMWLTNDDVCSSHVFEQQDANRQLTLFIFYGAGGDTLPCTPDDNISSLSNKSQYSALGNRIDLKGPSAGPDGLFNTQDDFYYYDYDYDSAH